MKFVYEYYMFMCYFKFYPCISYIYFSVLFMIDKLTHLFSLWLGAAKHAKTASHKKH